MTDSRLYLHFRQWVVLLALFWAQAGLFGNSMPDRASRGGFEPSPMEEAASLGGFERGLLALRDLVGPQVPAAQYESCVSDDDDPGLSRLGQKSISFRSRINLGSRCRREVGNPPNSYAWVDNSRSTGRRPFARAPPSTSHFL